MSGAAPFVLAASPWGSADPSPLPIRLEICRLQAELESLEARIADLGTPGDAVAAAEAPMAVRAEELVERMVASLREAGREEIDTASNRRRMEAQVQLDEARRRADAILDGARAELAAVLAERERAVGLALDDGLDVVVLSDVDVVVTAPAPAPVTAPADVDVEVVEPAPSSAMEVEEARTDVAFDLWMAVAPVAPASPAEPGPETEGARWEQSAAPTVTERDAPSRSHCLLPLEVVAALLAAVIVVVLVLVLVG